MIKGVITCNCGQLFGFETAQETICCPSCKVEYEAIQFGTLVEPEVIEEPQSEVTEDGTDI